MTDILELLDDIDANDANIETNATDSQTELPRYQLQNQRSFQLMVDYIKTHKSDIPEEYRNSCLFDIDNISLAVYWIYTMKTAPVPNWMRHDPNITDIRGWTIAMHYIYVNHCEPPLWMTCLPTIQTASSKQTVAMMYLMYRNDELKNTDIPDWMRHDADTIIDVDGYNLMDYWVQTNDDSAPIPNWMKSKNIGNSQSC